MKMYLADSLDLPEMPSGEVEIPNPPSAYEKPEISWFMLLLPLL